MCKNACLSIILAVLVIGLFASIEASAEVTYRFWNKAGPSGSGDSYWDIADRWCPEPAGYPESPDADDEAKITTGDTVTIRYDAVAAVVYLHKDNQAGGAINHVGGTANFGALYVSLSGVVVDRLAEYSLGSAATLYVGNEYIGAFGRGYFYQNGGYHSISGNLHLGTNNHAGIDLTGWDAADPDGRYTMYAGTLQVGGSEYIGYSHGDSYNQEPGQGRFDQFGGSHSVGTLYIGYQHDSSGVYNQGVAGASFSASGNAYIGYEGTGSFYQNGTFGTGGSLYIGHHGGTGLFIQNNGTTNTVGGDLHLGGSSTGTGTYNMGSGTLNLSGDLTLYASGSFNISSNLASITVGGDLTFEDGAAFSAAAGSVLHLTGSNFYNESTSASSLAGLGNTEFIFEGGVGVLDTFEAAGLVDGGFVGNFALGALTLGGAEVGHLQLVDDTDNGNRGAEGEECLFVFDLTINVGSSLDVNGFILYESGDHADEWNTWIGDGRLFDSTGEGLNAYYDSDNDWTTFASVGGVVPELGAIILIGGALVGLAGVLRRKTR